MTFLSLNFSFEDLYTSEGLARLDAAFLNYLHECDENLQARLQAARNIPPPPLEESALLIDLGPYVEDFIGQLFRIEKKISTLQEDIHHLNPLYKCKRVFIQRQAAKAYSREEALEFKGDVLKKTLSHLMEEPYSDLSFARHILKAIDQDNTSFLDIGKKYAAWALHQKAPSTLFRLPRKIDPDAKFTLIKEGHEIKSSHYQLRQGFDCTEPKTRKDESLDQAHYCILCHNQGKDSCSKGLTETNKGCPLDQKISEMNTLYAQGNALGALAMIMVDNPLVAATGHRICNDCKKACIFQKQDPVDIPKIETHILDSVLNLPWGVEVYSLLSRWNPLNIRHPFAKKLTGYKVLVAGMGPAGFTLAHYLLNEGHTVVGIDGLKIEPLERKLLTEPIRDWASLQEPLSTRTISGFGGVAEYGITARWDKNYLKLVRILLERRAHFALYDGVRLGGTLTLPQAFALGFDHIALCLGAGQPNRLGIPHETARGVRLASDFLMALQLTGAAQEKSLANLQIRLPILVIGGGLTAVDTATEALAYYCMQVEKFLSRSKEIGCLLPSLTEEEAKIAEEFIDHAVILRKGDRSFLNEASKILYRKKIQDSPAYRLNADELDLALQQGIEFVENTTPYEIKVDAYGHIEGLVVKRGSDLQTLPCRTLLVATGTHPNRSLEDEDPHLKIEGEDFLLSYNFQQNVSFFGDLHPSYQGNVVKAMASAKKGYLKVCKSLLKNSPSPAVDFFKRLNELLKPQVEMVRQLTPTIWEINVKAPLAAQNFKPGQFFRLQNYGPHGMEGLALTGAHADPETGLLSLIVLETGASSALCRFLKEGERVVLMGPSGTPTEIPVNETVLLIGGGLGNAVLFSIGNALKEKGNRVLYGAGYKTPGDLFKREEIEAVSGHVIWCFESLPEFYPTRPQDFVYEGNVIEGLFTYANSSPPLPLSEVDRIITIGSDQMMAAVACARKTVLKPYLKEGHKAIGSINSPMQCMMKGICGQCIQTLTDPLTGKTRIIFTCSAQDQALDEVDFRVLKGRLTQNSLLEKQTQQWTKGKLYDQ